MKVLLAIAIAVLVAVLMTVFSAVPPLSVIYNWAERNDIMAVWYGFIAGVIALCLLLLYRIQH